MRNLLRGIVIISVLILASCQDKDVDLIGNWQAAKLSENGDSLSIDPSLIRFYFSGEGQYRFESTLNYIEAGQYRWEAPLLYTQDTIRSQQEEKVVLIDWISSDSLLMRMHDEGKERELMLVRSGF